jgi:hypothetical protein
VAGWQNLAGCKPCRVSASHPGKDLAGDPALGLLSPSHSFERLLDNLALASSCPPAGLAAGMATTIHAQVWGTEGPKL